MGKVLAVVAAIFAIAYVAVTALPPYFNNAEFEEAVNAMLQDIDGVEAIDMSAETVKMEVQKLAKGRLIDLKDDDLEVTWERSGDEVLVEVAVDTTYDYVVLAIKKQVALEMHAENTIAVDVDEEQRRAVQRRSAEEAARAAHQEEEDMWRQKCDKLRGFYDGKYCVMPSGDKFEKFYF